MYTLQKKKNKWNELPITKGLFSSKEVATVYMVEWKEILLLWASSKELMINLYKIQL